MSNTCNKHYTFPEITRCDICRGNYEEVLLRWYGQKAVDNFRHLNQREVIPMAMKEVRK